MQFKTFFFTLLFASIIATNIYAQKFITTKGKDIIGVDGKPFLIKGTNLGNWLVPEGYMFKFKNINSRRLISETITGLIGSDAAKPFWKKDLDVYITTDE